MRCSWVWQLFKFCEIRFWDIFVFIEIAVQRKWCPRPRLKRRLAGTPATAGILARKGRRAASAAYGWVALTFLYTRLTAAAGDPTNTNIVLGNYQTTSENLPELNGG